MSSVEMSNEAVQQHAEYPIDPARKRAKRILAGFGATTAVGLVLTGWYVGGRIFAVQKVHAAVASAKPATSTPAPKPVAAIPVAAAPVAAAPAAEVPAAKKAGESKIADSAAWTVFTPQPGEIYLQIAALGPHSTDDYMKILAGKGISARVAAGPSENLYRVLIGPYADKAARQKRQEELQAAGIETFVRAY